MTQTLILQKETKETKTSKTRAMPLGLMTYFLRFLR